MDIWVSTPPHVLAIVTNPAAINICVQVFVWTDVFKFYLLIYFWLH